MSCAQNQPLGGPPVRRAGEAGLPPKPIQGVQFSFQVFPCRANFLLTWPVHPIERIDWPMDLQKLLDNCKKQDPLAWEELVRQFQCRVTRLAFHYLKNAEDARDLTQEIFVRLYSNLESCENEKMLLPWLVRITRNAAIDQLRRRKARPPVSDIPAEDVWTLAHQERTPSERWEIASRKKLVRHCLSRMTFLNRQVIEMKEFQHLSLEEIATRLEVPVGTIKSRSHRARSEFERLLRALLGSSPRRLCDLEDVS